MKNTLVFVDICFEGLKVVEFRKDDAKRKFHSLIRDKVDEILLVCKV